MYAADITFSYNIFAKGITFRFYQSVALNMDMIGICLSFVLLGLTRASPSVSVVGEDAYMNWTISNNDKLNNRFLNSPSDTILLAFYPNSFVPSQDFSSTRIRYTGDLASSVLSFVLKNVTSMDFGRYKFVAMNGIVQHDLGGQVLVVAERPKNLGITYPSLPAVEGQEYKLNCSAESRSHPANHNLTMCSKWMKNGTNITLESDYSVHMTYLTFSNLNRKDNSTVITCRVYEDKRRISEESKPFVLNILYGPDTILPSPTDVLTVNEGDSINITCTGECNPACSSYQWRKKPQTDIVGSNQSYLITAAMRNHSGVYTCTVININISKNATADITVSVNYGPDPGKITISPSEISYDRIESSSLDVNCSADCNPYCQYEWTGPSGGNYANTSILSIRDIKRYHAGVFICAVNNPHITSKSATATISVAVFYGPDTVDLTPNSVDYILNESNILPNVRCSSECFPPCTSYWYKDQNKIPGNQEDMLSLGDVYRNDSGKYICRSINTKSNFTQETAFNLVVQYPPTVKMESRNGSYIDTGLMISCSAKGIPEKYIISLIHSSLFSGVTIRQIINNVPVSTGVFVHWFSNSSFMDTGVYTCIVNNGVLDYRDGSLDRNMSDTVWIKGPPKVTSNETYFYAEKGHTGRLLIEFYNSLLEPNITWKINHTLEKLESNDKYNISVVSAMVAVQFYSKLLHQPGFTSALEIQNVTEDDFSSYQIHLQNSAGNLTKWTVHLRPRGRPDVPKDFYIVPNSITSSSVNIQWVPGFNGGSSQTFIIEYKNNMDKIWSNYSDTEIMIQSQDYNITVQGLSPNTLYFFQMYAHNMFGRSEYSVIINATTYAETKTEMSKTYNMPDGGIIGGVVGAAVLLSIAVAIVVIIRYRKKTAQKSQGTDTHQGLMERSRPESGLVDNPVYDSFEPPKLGLSSNSDPTGVEFAKVSNHEKNTDKVEDPCHMYAIVDKSNKKRKKSTSYQNAAPVGNGSNRDDMYKNSKNVTRETITKNVYEDSGLAASNDLLVNKDGLLYAELMLGPSTTINGKPLIRGIEDRTEYADISYGKRGKPLPDSDEEREIGK